MSEPLIVERRKNVVIKRYGEAVLDMTTTDAEELRKQLDEALKDPFEGYGLPWRHTPSSSWLRTVDGGLVTTLWQDSLAKAFASLSEAEQRQFLMRGMS